MLPEGFLFRPDKRNLEFFSDDHVKKKVSNMVLESLEEGNIFSESFVRMKVLETPLERGNSQEASGMDMEHKNGEDDGIQEGLPIGKKWMFSMF